MEYDEILEAIRVNDVSNLKLQQMITKIDLNVDFVSLFMYV